MNKNKKNQFILQITKFAFLLLFVGGCSPFAPTQAGASSPVASSIPGATTVQDTPKQSATLTASPMAYPPLQSTATAEPYPPQRPLKPTPFFTAMPEVHWNIDALEFSWPGYDAIAQPEWLNNSIAKLAVYVSGPDIGYITADISAGKNAQAVKTPTNSDWQILSPNHSYVIECKDGMKLYRVQDNSLVSETSLLLPVSSGVNCSTFIQWAADESAAAFLAADLSVFIWKSNGTEPVKVFGPLSSMYTNIAWSPDSQKMAFVKSTTRSSNGSQLGTAVILDNEGQLLHEVQVQIVDSAIVGWLTNDVLASIWRYETWYYDLKSGELLFSWQDMPTGNGIFHQYPRVSPDGRWVFIDQGDQSHESTTQPNRYINEKQYTLYDIQTKSLIPLLDHPETYLLFAGWNADSSEMYVISRPAESTSKSSPFAPFGLLAFDPITREFDPLFKDAVQVAWNTDQNWGFIVFTAQNAEGNLGLAGGLWKPGTQTVIGQINLSNQMVYQDPARDTTFSAFRGPIPVIWSHDNQRVAVGDQFGIVRLVNEDGTAQILTTQMPGTVTLCWSPDDQHLLALSGNRAWIVDVSNSK